MTEKNSLDLYYDMREGSMTEKNPLDLYYDMKEGRIKLASKENSSGAVELLNNYISLLRVIYLVHQNGHWKCAGSNFYGDHLLFERLYNNAKDRVDAIAEKLIGIYGNDSFDHKVSLDKIAELNKFNSEDHIDNSLEAEKAFIQYAEDVYNRIKEMGEMTLGLDDLIMGQVSEAEESVYLLNQRKGVSNE